MVAGNKYTFNITGTMDGSQITYSKDNALNTYNVFEEDGTTPAIGTDYNDITRLDVFFDGAKLSIIASGASDAIDVELTPFDDISSTNVQDGMEEINDKVNSLGVDKETLAMPVGEAEQWTKKTEMNVKPDDDGWSLIFDTGTTSNVDGIFNITTTTGQAQRYDIEAGNITPANKKLILWRTRINSDEGDAAAPSQQVNIGDGVRIAQVIVTTTDLSTLVDGVLTIVDTRDYTIFRNIAYTVDNVNGIEIFVDGVSVFTAIYTRLLASGDNWITFGDSSASGEIYSSDVDWDYIYYQLDLDANPDIATGWFIDGDLMSASVTTVNTFTVDDSSVFSPKPLNASGLTWVNDILRLNVDRVDDNTIKLFALDDNVDVFDFDFDIIKG
jgi:hypothetical protein